MDIKKRKKIVWVTILIFIGFRFIYIFRDIENIQIKNTEDIILLIVVILILLIAIRNLTLLYKVDMEK